ncbi:WD repeat-containing protein 25 isoform X3 [Hyla sarda]|uniref:WD repeat-containing protein 25 isoform X3 n=1 Tax=Hyla sarda TaxID=327740 RepID=UPI0024C3ABB9|nr:WD repeat-containing protein 25 isoform X3 [Hyla sarda]
MNFLVAYDDSDSDTEDGGQPHEPQVTEARPVHPVLLQQQSDATPPPPGLNTLGGSSSFGKDFSLTDKCLVSYTKDNSTYKGISNSPIKMPVLPAQKRPLPSTGGVVKPYVPKRLRQEQTNMAAEVHCDTSVKSHDHISHSAKKIYRVSEYLGPHLSVKYGSSGIPKKVVFEMREHAGAVNRVQWCPVKQYSHLLLSASMDGTCKVWDAIDSGKSLCTISCHRAAVRDAQWSSCGRKILTGGFDTFLHLTDVETGKDLFTAKNECKISAIRFHPQDQNLFICGGFSPVITAHDVRMGKERYTCPSLALHPKESVFAAQTNGNYIALFSAQRPYKMNKKRRFEGHKVEGFAVGCQFSPDGSVIVTGSSEGNVVFYNYHTSKIIRTFPSQGSACRHSLLDQGLRGVHREVDKWLRHSLVTSPRVIDCTCFPAERSARSGPEDGRDLWTVQRTRVMAQANMADNSGGESWETNRRTGRRREHGSCPCWAGAESVEEPQPMASHTAWSNDVHIQ